MENKQQQIKQALKTLEELDIIFSDDETATIDNLDELIEKLQSLDEHELYLLKAYTNNELPSISELLEIVGDGFVGIEGVVYITTAKI